MPSYQESQDKLIISFSGELDTATCIDFEDGLLEKINNGSGSVVFDLENIGNISSMFLRICTKTVQKTGKEKFSIVNVPEQAIKVFELTRLDSFLNISKGPF